MPDEVHITFISKQITELVSKITSKSWSPRGESVPFAGEVLARDTSPWTITIRAETSEDSYVQDVTRAWHVLWIIERMLAGHIATLEKMENKSEKSSEEK